ncbi:hypothetical protein, partial [Escherichia coli]|uniref:hypothetical protein n=1 Tax=Escherichia coli TaxID=562 RepID=UPI003D35AAE5
AGLRVRGQRSIRHCERSEATTQGKRLKPPTPKPPTIGKIHQLSAFFALHQNQKTADFRHSSVWHA